MKNPEISQKIKQIISNITSIPVDEIGDTASFRDELDLDSLSLLEIGVDVDYEFKLGVPEERLHGLDTVEQTAELVMERLSEKTPAVA